MTGPAPEEQFTVHGPFDAPRPVRASWSSTPAVRRSMQGNRRKDTTPELALRRLLHAAGYRYRVDAQPLPGLRRRADLVFRRRRVAVFVDGCYWHGCPEHYTPPRTNSGYWSAKVGANVRRDRDTDARLVEAGWTVVRLWEHEDPTAALAVVVQALDPR